MTRTNRTKIVCTMGPATEDDEVLRQMIASGMSVARLNFSHGDHEYHRTNIERVRRVAAEMGATVAIMVDTKGPEIRTGHTKGHQPVMLESGSHVTIYTQPVEATSTCFSLDYAALPREVSPGSQIFVDDGLICLEVERVEGDEIYCMVVNSGLLGEHKGVNVPNVKMELPSVTDRDKDDIRFSCEMDVDAIAASFVRDAQAVREIRQLCRDCGRDDIMIISKIESALALDCLDEILYESDGIMVARGDLGVEIPSAEVPYVQKDIIHRCNAAYRPVITATQMLDSMTRYPRPTRAEVTDVANAIYDGSDCVMLSGETAAGKYPVESVRMMAEICRQSEQHLLMRHTYHQREGRKNVSGVACFGAVEMAERVGASAILCPTESGRTPRIISAFRPHFPLIAITPHERTLRKTAFYWGVTGILSIEQEDLVRICYNSLRITRKAGLVKQDDLVVITAGDPVTSPLTERSETSTNVCMIAQVF